MSVKFEEVKKNISSIANRESYNKDFIFELMAAYGRSSASITKLRQGDLNVAEDKESEVIQRGVIYFKSVSRDTVLFSISDSLKQSPLTARFNPRYIIVTDFENLVAIDTKKSNTTLSCKIRDLDRNIDFFWAWTGEEKIDEKTEAVADKKAAEKMKQLYEEIEKVNSQSLERDSVGYRHELNLFFTRLLFCFFAEDTRVFSRDEKSIFTNSIKDFTQVDGSDLDTFLSKLFFSLNTEDKSSIDSPFSKFPYVNGSLFDINKRKITIPKFNAQARKIILECGGLNWSDINPDIFGSMFQGIVDEKHRNENGMHYTSVPNILKTLEPLFLDDIREDFDKNFNNPLKLQKLLFRISKIKIFDPACGSGNFLIIAYKELRKIEHAILQNLLSDKIPVKLTSVISLDNFFGIEIDDFSHEIAILSLFIAKHQMNVQFEEQFGKEIKLIPLKEKANIVLGNSTRLDWDIVCPNTAKKRNYKAYIQNSLIDVEPEQSNLFKDETSDNYEYEEIYLVGNPPFEGSRKQNKQQKDDLEFVFSKISKKYKSMDYVNIWFYKAAKWLKDNNKAGIALVSTNSISQGLQIELIWPLIFDLNIEIDFAYTSFRWKNSAKDNAGVSCVIIGMSKRNLADKFIIDNNFKKYVKKISPYIREVSNTSSVVSRQIPLSNFPEMYFGNMPADEGYLLLDEEEKNFLLKNYPNSINYIKKFIGARELIQDTNKRYCLWLTDVSEEEIDAIPFIKERVSKVKEIRLTSSRPKLAKIPHLFAQITADPSKFDTCLIFPGVSSENREYVPLRFSTKDEVIANSCLVVPNASWALFAICTSRMHMVWLRSVGGRMKTDLRYSKNLVYNTFPIRNLTNKEEFEISNLGKNIAFTRENHIGRPLADLYDPTTMPNDLRDAHHELNLKIDKIYRDKPFLNDEERLSCLFSLYDEMIKKERKN